MKPKILVVDDEPELLDLVEFCLREAQFEVETATRSLAALGKIRQSPPHLLVLDIMMPEFGGLELCKLLKPDPATKRIPILILTAKASESDRVQGLEAGADDYLIKPFSPRELILRIEKLIQRNKASEVPLDKLVFGHLVIDLIRHSVSWRGHDIILTNTEFKLLTTLAFRRGRVQSREVLLRDVWGYDGTVDSRTVDTHLHRLRDKLGEAGKFLHTQRGVGYRFCEED